MRTYVALLRGINVGGRSMVGMSALREMLGELGFGDVRSLLQSGNLLFGTDRRTTTAALEALLEKETAKRLGVSPDYVVRSAAEWAAVVANNPAPDEAKRDPGHLVVMFLKHAAAAKNVKKLEAAIRGRETVRAVGKQLYVVYPDGIGRSKLTNAVIERELGTRATGRNWNTVLKLAALLAPA